jgi:hypothetical protein
MDISPHVEAIRSSLAAVAGDDETTAATAERLALAVGPAVQLQLLDLLSQVALEITSQLPSGRVDVQLAGRDALLVFSDPTSEAGSPGPGAGDDDSGTARITLRLPESLKTAVETTAAQAGQSTNAWLVGAVRRSLEPRPSHRRSGGQRLTGWTQA